VHVAVVYCLNASHMDREMQELNHDIHHLRVNGIKYEHAVCMVQQKSNILWVGCTSTS